jgi:hypothetical protein
MSKDTGLNHENAADLLDMLGRLLNWRDSVFGGSEAPVWDEAERMFADLAGDPRHRRGLDDDADPLEAEDDGDALASAGLGTDEDYRHDDLSHDDGSSNPLNEDGGWRDE